VVQRRGVLGLGPEPGPEGGVPGELAPQDLHRDGAFEQRVAGPPHPAHPTARERYEQLVPVAEQATPGFHERSSLSARPDEGPDLPRLPGGGRQNPVRLASAPFG
jgi:hypothetical protein